MTGLQVFTAFHVIISLIGIAAGFVVLFRWIKGLGLDRWNTIFLVTTIGTSVSGFGFPFTKFLPSHAFGILSLIVLSVSLYALYSRKLVGIWRPTYVITATFAQYLNFFVLIVQAFLKIPFFNSLAPTQSEPPFAIAHLLALVAFLVMGFLATRRFKTTAVGAA